MRKIIGLILAAAMITIGSRAFAANNVNIEVVLTLQSININTNVGSLAVAVATGTARVSDRIVVQNTGSTAEDFSIKLTSTTGSWTAVSGTPGTDQYRISAIWHHFSTLKSTMTGEFQANDVLTSTPQQSSDSVFFHDTDLHTVDTDGVTPLTNLKGYNVAVGQERNLFFKIDAPAAITPGNITASASVSISAAAIP